MGFEDDYNPSGTITVINRYGLGARGIDRIERYASSSTTYGYPMYDGHGSMRAVLAKSGSTYTTGNWRTYDVWGSLRSGGSSSDPEQAYCASLGHVDDAETDLIYMRARYMEPSTGRFISEDPSRDGTNWFTYCRNDPINLTDQTGRFAPFLVSLIMILIEGIISAAVDVLWQMTIHGRSWDHVDWGEVGVSFAFGLVGGALGHFARASFYLTKTPLHRIAWYEGEGAFSTYFMKFIGVGTGTSLTRYHFQAVFRAMLMGGLGHMAMHLYGAYALSYLEE